MTCFIWSFSCIVWNEYFSIRLLLNMETFAMYAISWIILAFWLVLMLKWSIGQNHRWHYHEQHLSFNHIKQTASMLLWVCTVADQRRRQNVVITSMIHLAVPGMSPFCSYHISTSSVIYGWMGHMVKWNLFFKLCKVQKEKFDVFCLLLHFDICYKIDRQQHEMK